MARVSPGAFLNQVKTETAKIVWPSRKETTAFTWVVLIVVAFVSLYLGAIDYLISLVMRAAF